MAKPGAPQIKNKMPKGPPCQLARDPTAKGKIMIPTGNLGSWYGQEAADQLRGQEPIRPCRLSSKGPTEHRERRKLMCYIRDATGSLLQARRNSS